MVSLFVIPYFEPICCDSPFISVFLNVLLSPLAKRELPVYPILQSINQEFVQIDELIPVLDDTGAPGIFGTRNIKLTPHQSASPSGITS